MDRRRAIVLLGAAALPLAGCSEAPMKNFNDIASAIRAVEGLVPSGRSTGVWSLAQVLNHAAQSVEYSMSGFPQPKGALFQATLGKAAFAVFSTRGRMSHSLSEPISGAPALVAGDPLPAAAARLVKSLRDFDAYAGPLKPHFAYGDLDKAQYTCAHLMHLADHWAEFKETAA